MSIALSATSSCVRCRVAETLWLHRATRRAVSTTSAIKSGLRASRDRGPAADRTSGRDGRSGERGRERGKGRDRSYQAQSLGPSSNERLADRTPIPIRPTHPKIVGFRRDRDSAAGVGVDLDDANNTFHFRARGAARSSEQATPSQTEALTRESRRRGKRDRERYRAAQSRWFFPGHAARGATGKEDVVESKAQVGPDQPTRLGEGAGQRLRASQGTTPSRFLPDISPVALKGGLASIVSSIKVLVQTIQTAENSSYPPAASLIAETTAALGRVNKIVEKTRWKESGRSNPGRMMFAQKMGKSGLYLESGAENTSRSVITQSPDGTFELALKSARKPRQPVRTGGSQKLSGEAADHVAQLTGAARQQALAESARTRPDSRRRDQDNGHDSDDEQDDMPLSVPYTTAASEFLYGTSVVLAALRAQRRRLYKLHLHSRAFERELNYNEIVSLAEEHGVEVQRQSNVRLLDRMSEERPHNGVVLEASSLPTPPVLAMGTPSAEDGRTPLTCSHQSLEALSINDAAGATHGFPFNNSLWRQPVVIMLDGILDPGNIGNILRTAHFYGVDAVAVATNTCCSLSSKLLAKASAGACEAVRLLALPKPAHFVRESRKAGWKVYAAAAPATTAIAVAQRGDKREVSTESIAASSPLRIKPCILMLGSEGTGLRQNLLRQADRLVVIERGDAAVDALDVGVDSLNVGAAAGVLMESFLRRRREELFRKVLPPQENGNHAGSNYLGW